MGFPLAYSDLFLPKLLLHFLTLLGLIRKLLLLVFSFLKLSDFLEPESTTTPPLSYSFQTGPTGSVSAALIRELLPVVKYSDLDETDMDPLDKCAVCLYEFCCDDEIRRLRNCRHIFHMGCLDRWMDCDQKTCPLCRTQFVPEEMQEDFNEMLWVASGISEFSCEFSPVGTGL